MTGNTFQKICSELRNKKEMEHTSVYDLIYIYLYKTTVWDRALNVYESYFTVSWNASFQMLWNSFMMECYCHLKEVNVKYYYLLQFIVNTVKRFLNVFHNTLFNRRIFIFLKQRCTYSQSLFGHTRIFISSQTKQNKLRIF